jgi:hypothetical protein
MLTRSETFAYAKKATRGAGFSWGMAEEAANATVALFVAGHDGFEALIPILQNADGKAQPLLSTDTNICGLTVGTYLSDCGKSPTGEKVVGPEILNALCGSLDQGVQSFPHDAPQIIKDFAQRTYVPDSEESRLRGAG